MAAFCRIRIPEAYKEANDFFADEFLFKKKWTQVEQKNFGFLDLKFDRNKKRQETDSSGKKHFLPEYLVLSDYFKTSQIQNQSMISLDKFENRNIIHCRQKGYLFCNDIEIVKHQLTQTYINAQLA